MHENILDSKYHLNSINNNLYVHIKICMKNSCKNIQQTCRGFIENTFSTKYYL